MNRCFHELVQAIGPLEFQIEEAQDALKDESLSHAEAHEIQETLSRLTGKLEQLQSKIKEASKK